MENSQKHPLALPKGSIRAVLSLLTIGGFIVACFVRSVPKENLIALSGLAGMVSAYYFRTREEESISNSTISQPYIAPVSKTAINVLSTE